MKILIAADTFFPKKDGVIIFIKEMIRYLKYSYPLSLVVPRYSGKSISGVKTVYLDITKSNISGYQRIRFGRSNRKKIKEAVRSADMVWIQDLAPVGILAYIYSRIYKKKRVFFFHQFIWEQAAGAVNLPPLLKSLIKNIIRWIARLVYNGEFLMIPYMELKKKLEENGISADTREVRLGIDPSRFLPSEDKPLDKKIVGIAEGSIIVGYAGRISREKNLEILLEAFERLRKKYPKLVLLLVGSGDKKYIERFDRKGVILTGFVNDVERYLRAMDIFVMPSLTETTSLATLEAMSCGIPVITTKVGFMEQYVIKGYNGYHFPKVSANSLAMIIDRMIKDKDLRMFLSKNARRTAEKLNWHNTAEKVKLVMEEIYEER